MIYRLRTTAAALCLAVPVGVALTGCQPTQAGAAMVIDDQRIPVSDVQADVSELVAEETRTHQQVQPTARITQAQLQQRIELHAVERAAARLGVTVSRAEVDRQRLLLEQQAGGPEALAKEAAAANRVPSDLDSALRTLLLVNKIGDKLVPSARTPLDLQDREEKVREEVTRAVQAMRITVNPRYGVLRTDSLAIEPDFGSFVKPERPPVPQQLSQLEQ